MRLLHLLSLALLLPVAGCLDAPEATDDLDVEAEPEPSDRDPWRGADRILVAQRDVPAGGVMEFDVLCTFGGTDFYDLPREAAVPDDAAAVEFEVRSGATTTGVQAGYEPGGREGAITWLPIVSGASETFRVEAGAVGVDADFKYQLNTADDEACYTGASLGDYSIHVYAVRT